MQQRHRYACLQLVTMAREQRAKVAAAACDAGDAALHAASQTHLATASDARTGRVVAAGLFHLLGSICIAGHSSKGATGSTCCWQACSGQIDLVCCNSPGQGVGSSLLRAIEGFVAHAGCCCSQGSGRTGGRGAGAGELSICSPQHTRQFARVAHVRLLSVQSSREFYARRGYCDCAGARGWMVKRLCWAAARPLGGCLPARPRGPQPLSSHNTALTAAGAVAEAVHLQMLHRAGSPGWQLGGDAAAQPSVLVPSKARDDGHNCIVQAHWQLSALLDADNGEGEDGVLPLAAFAILSVAARGADAGLGHVV